MQAHLRLPRRTPIKTAITLALCGAALALLGLGPTCAAADMAAPAAGQAANPLALPGNDFFAYANHDWLNSVEIPADRSSWGVFEELGEVTNQRILKLIEAVGADANASAEAKKVAAYYKTFMDEAAIEAQGLAPLQQVLRPIAALRNKAELTRALGASLRADVDPLNATNFYTENIFGIWVAQGLTDPAHNTAYLMQGGLGMPDRAYYLDATPMMEKLRGQYLAHIANTLKLAGLDDVDARAARVFALEMKIAKSHATREDSADILKANNSWKAAEFARKAPGMDWKTFLQGAKLDKQQKFIVYHPGAIKGAAALVGSESLEAWKDFLSYHALNHLSPALPKALADEYFDFNGRTLSGTPQQALRWKRSLAAVNAAMPDALGKMYVTRYFPAESKARLQTMVSNIIAAFHTRIDQLDWMAPSTRKEAHAKLTTLYVGIGYPDKWAVYDSLEVRPGDAVGNLLRGEQLHTQQQLAKLNQPVDRTEWCMPAQLVNAVNMPLQNAMNFPAAILQSPNFDPAAGDAINYGAIGATIGHEISHSFDDQGAQFDSLGRLRDWWTKADSAHFQKASDVLVKQYSDYQAFADLHLNGQLTLSENLADLAGLSAAHDAFRKTLAGQADVAAADRQFFTSYGMSWRSKRRDASMRRIVLADGHAPAQWRTYTVRNLEAWYQAFDVRPGQTLYLAPQQRVRVW